MKIYVDYYAYLGSLYKLEENHTLDEKDLAIKYNLYSRAVKLRKLSDNRYYVEDILYMTERYLSEKSLLKSERVAIEVTNDELVQLDIPFEHIYELNILVGNYFERKMHDLCLLEELTEEELLTIENEEVVCAYNSLTADQKRYALEENNDGLFEIVSLHDNSPVKAYYIISECHPASLDELVTYYEAVAPNTYTKVNKSLKPAIKRRRKFKR